MKKSERDELARILYEHTWDARIRVKEWLDGVEVEEGTKNALDANSEPVRGTRSDNQNRAIHLWLTLVADELDKRGHTVQDVVKAIRRAEIRPNKDVLKEVMWRPYQKAKLGKESTTQLSKLEVDTVYEGLNKWLGEQFELHVPFPSNENKEEWEKHPALQKREKREYPEYTGSPTI